MGAYPGEASGGSSRSSKGQSGEGFCEGICDHRELAKDEASPEEGCVRRSAGAHNDAAAGGQAYSLLELP